MGTRSLTFVYDEQGNKIINLYRQFDGYPTGHGQELAEFLNEQEYYNGANDLAALLVAHFKKEPMGFYLYHPDEEDCGQDYEYHLYENKVVVQDPGEVIFEGNWNEFEKFCVEAE